MADGGISERGGSRRTTSLFKSPDRRFTEKKAGTALPSPSGKAGDFHSDVKEMLKNKQRSETTANKVSAQPASADQPVTADDDIGDDKNDKQKVTVLSPGRD